MALPPIGITSVSSAGQDIRQRIRSKLGGRINSGVAGLDVAFIAIVAAIAWVASRR